ncbi:alginate O-acetyltransferase AlgX-related protein [Owenweeksia hongkongensis]|uniref:alginate O-acetyltransferase AlgX-related protein n=1 Tax=Owenweeksia hongkongensis TaxID=253245 RepID=UPI003A8F5524
MRKEGIKRWILGFFMVIITYPIIETFIPVRLAGQVNRADLTSNLLPFNAETWFSGDFQSTFERYMNDNIGLFPLFIRIHNQLEYTLFGNTYTGNVVEGKEGYLYEQIYIDSYFGEDFKGLSVIEKNTAQLKELQDKLESKGKYLMFCLAAGKSTYFPEYLPYSQEKDSTNYEYYSKEFVKQGVNHINANPWFLKMKDSLGYLLYPQYGIHWSHYGAMLVTDSIVQYMEKGTGWDLPNMAITQLNYSPVARYYDNDIAHSLNLFYEVQPEPMIYPDFEWRGEKGDKPRKLLIIGDSFTWDIFENSRIGEECFHDVQFWFYNQTVHRDVKTEGSENNGLPTLTRHLDFYKIMQEYDAFLIVSNEPNLSSFGWGFAKDALSILEDPNYRPRERNNEYLRDQAKNKKEWREALTHQAKERGITLDSMINIYLHNPNYTP